MSALRSYNVRPAASRIVNALPKRRACGPPAKHFEQFLRAGLKVYEGAKPPLMLEYLHARIWAKGPDGPGLARLKEILLQQAAPASKRNLTFNLLDPDQIRLTLCYTNYRSLNCNSFGAFGPSGCNYRCFDGNILA